MKNKKKLFNKTGARFVLVNSDHLILEEFQLEEIKTLIPKIFHILFDVSRQELNLQEWDILFPNFYSRQRNFVNVYRLYFKEDNSFLAHTPQLTLGLAKELGDLKSLEDLPLSRNFKLGSHELDKRALEIARKIYQERHERVTLFSVRADKFVRPTELYAFCYPPRKVVFPRVKFVNPHDETQENKPKERSYKLQEPNLKKRYRFAARRYHLNDYLKVQSAHEYLHHNSNLHSFQQFYFSRYYNSLRVFPIKQIRKVGRVNKLRKYFWEESGDLSKNSKRRGSGWKEQTKRRKAWERESDKRTVSHYLSDNDLGDVAFREDW